MHFNLVSPGHFMLALTDNQQAGAAAAIGGTILLIIIGIGLAAHLFFSFCYKRIVEKCGTEAGVLVWIPILQFVPLFQAARQAGWMAILILIPLVNAFAVIYLFWKLCETRGKPGWMALLILVPFGFLFLVPFLAFSE